MEQIGQVNNNCNTKATLSACANNVPYLVIVSDGCCDDQLIKYVNLNTGAIETSMPVGLTIGECKQETCIKEYKDACANGVPYLVAISDSCSTTDVAGLEFINLLTGGKTTTAPEGIQYWSCDAVPTQSCVAYLETESFVATAGQTTFNISQVASGDVRLSRNGATLHDGAAVVTGTTVTYVQGPNNAEPLLEGDRIDISYIYVDCEQIAKNFTDCIGNELAAETSLVTCAALNPKHFEIDPSTGQISSKCCDTADFISADANNTLTVGSDGKIYNAVSATPDFAQTVYVNSTSPSTATIFDLNNPPTTNDDALKADVNNIYIGTDGSAWTYNSSTGTYSTYAYPTVPTVTETNNSIKVNNTLQQWNVDTNASSGIRTVTFPIPYSSVPSVQLTAINADAQARTPSLVSVSTTGFSFRVWLDTTNTASAANVYWTAIGKKF